MRVVIAILLLFALLVALPSFASDIYTASKEGDLVTVKKLLREDPGLLNAKDENHMTPLITAAIEGNLKVVKYLVSQGAEIDLGDRENTTPLQNAALSGQMKVVKYLLKKGADLQKIDDNGHNAVTWAAARGQTEMFEYLLKKGADIMIEGKGGTAALRSAAYYNHIDIVKLLLKKGVPLEERNSYGYTPLLSATSAGNCEVMQLLIDAGADINVKLSENNESLLHNAAMSGKVDAIDLVISNGADIEARDNFGRSPIFFSLYSREPAALAKMIEKGADVNVKNEDGATLVQVAARVEMPEMVKMLIDAKVDVNIADKDNTTPLYWAVMTGNEEIAKMLLSNGADPNIAEKNSGDNPLHLASIKGQNGITKLLLKHGSEVNTVNSAGLSPLALAKKYGNKITSKFITIKGGKAENVEENFDASKYLDQELADGEALLWYMGHCGWAVKTQNHFMVFDFWNRCGMPDEPSIANGKINPAEIAGQNFEVFATHEHGDHFDTTIFEWADKVQNIQYFYGFEPQALPQYRETAYNGPEYTYTAPRTSSTVDGMKINTIDANDAGVGYLIEVDGVTIYHAGDHAGWREGERDGFFAEIDYLAGISTNVDVAFLNVTGCHMQDKDAMREGNYYTMEKLNTKVLIPTHSLYNSQAYKDFADEAKNQFPDIEYYCPDNAGDRFMYNLSKDVEVSQK